MRALRRERHLGTARRREVLPRLLGQEDRRRRNRRTRIRAETLYPRSQRGEISHLPLDAEAAMRPADRRRRWVRSVSDIDAVSELWMGRAGLPPGKRSRRADLLRDPRR